jgi:hypothetical protein
VKKEVSFVKDLSSRVKDNSIKFNKQLTSSPEFDILGNEKVKRYKNIYVEL